MNAERWRPHFPDPAAVDPHRPGLRAHRHPRDRMHGWVFAQHQVWIDYWGNEIELETMSREYATNVLAFVREQAERIRNLVLIDLLGRVLISTPADLPALQEARSAFDVGAVEWLEGTPFVRALVRRLHESAS